MALIDGAHTQSMPSYKYQLNAGLVSKQENSKKYIIINGHHHQNVFCVLLCKGTLS